MKSKYVKAVVVVAICVLGVVALAQKQAQHDRVFLLKAGGEVLGELHLRGTGNVSVEGSAGHLGGVDYNAGTRVMSAKGGAILTFKAGTNIISVHA
jgi:hypothetical protein